MDYIKDLNKFRTKINNNKNMVGATSMSNINSTNISLKPVLPNLSENIILNDNKIDNISSKKIHNLKNMNVSKKIESLDKLTFNSTNNDKRITTDSNISTPDSLPQDCEIDEEFQE
jgi:hypothetical protein